MSEEELIETLKEFEKSRVEQLKEPSKNLFYAIMKIADERDKYKEVLDKIKEILNKTNNLTLNETGYKEYLKSNFIKDKDIFKTICHLEDFELVYGEIMKLLEEIE